MIRFLLICLLLFPYNNFIFSYVCSEFADSLQIVGKYFQEIDSVCREDDGRLWGVRLNSPFLFIDEERRVYANQPDLEQKLHQEGSVYVGFFPDSLPIANSTTFFAGRKWTMVMLPVPADAFSCHTLFMHEIFHFWQDSLHLSLHSYQNGHLEKMSARLYLRLEWEALDAAVLATSKIERRLHIHNALCYRQYRHSLYPSQVQDEAFFELDEGLPQYTGMKLSAQSDVDFVEHLHLSKKEYTSKENLTRTFGYHSGAVYAFLLDQEMPDWKRTLTRDDDLASLLQKACHISLPLDLKDYIDSLQDNYSYSLLYRAESMRENARQQLLAEKKVLFLSKQTLRLPLQSPRFSFNPETLFVLEGLGTVYPTIRLVDFWGTLEVSNLGCLISSDWKSAILPFSTSPLFEGNLIETSEWKLWLNPGFRISEQVDGYQISEK